MNVAHRLDRASDYVCQGKFFGFHYSRDFSEFAPVSPPVYRSRRASVVKCYTWGRNLVLY